MDEKKRTITHTLLTDKGFTLIDSLVAIAIFSIGFMALTAVMISSSKTTRGTVYADWSVMSGQETVEMLTVLDMNQNVLSDGAHQPGGADTNPEAAKTAIDYRVYDATDVDGDGTNDFVTIAYSATADNELRLQGFYRRQSN